jgi:hypothetical protein
MIRRAGLAIGLCCCALIAPADAPPSVTAALQAEIDAQPGQPFFLPAGEHLLDAPLFLRGDGGGLWGPGTLVQQNPNAAILRVENAAHVRITGVTLARPADAPAEEPGLLIMDCRDVVVDGITVRDNQCRRGAIEVRQSRHVTVRGCSVWNYKRIAVDDRTDSEHYGYAFQCIDGHGILAEHSQHLQLLHNRVVEERWLPTRENAETHGLGKLVDGKKPTFQGTFAAGPIRDGRVDNWHQGSAILVTGPKTSRFIQVIDNTIENAAQGIDLHCDDVTVAHNVVDHGMIGIKATHGVQNLNITGNTLSAIDLWGILVMPGAASHAPREAAADVEALPSNTDANVIIDGNIITDFGHGHEYWNWGGRNEDGGSSFAIALQRGQLSANPPLRNVLVRGNIVTPGEAGGGAPRYRYAVQVDQDHPDHKDQPRGPVDLRFEGNSFTPGKQGVSNIDVP